MVWSKGGALKLIGNQPLAPEQPDPNNVPLLKQVNNVPVARNIHDPKSWQERNAEQFRSAGVVNNIVRNMGNFDEEADPRFDWAAKSEKLSSQIARIQQQLAEQRQKNAQIRLANSQVNVPNINVNLGGGGAIFSNANLPGGRFGDFMRAIAGQESGGSYGAVNSSSGALGKYQIMPANFTGAGGWDMEALGRDITAQQFLSSPKLQEAIARHKLLSYFKKYGVRGAASAWYSGDPNRYHSTASQGAYPSVAAYVAAIIRRMHGG